MPLDNPDVIQMAVPEYRMDQIIAIVTGSFSVGAGVDDGFGNITVTSATDDKPVPSADFYHIKGIWSSDGGTSWQEFGNSVIYGSHANGLKTLDVSTDSTLLAGVASLGIIADNSDTGGHSIIYKALLLARADQDDVPVGSLVQLLRYSSQNNYMKIHSEGVVDLDPTNPVVVAHSLGYVPNVNVWYKQTFTSVGDPADGTIDMFQGDADVVVDATTITFGNKGFAGLLEYKAYYRVYLDD